MERSSALKALNAYAAGYVDSEGQCDHDCDDTREFVAEKAFVALRAVLKEHPVNPGGGSPWCMGCGDIITAPDWPCRTVAAIEKVLYSSE